MAELVVRELEKEAALQAKREAAAAAGQEMEKFMRRAVSCFEDRAVLFVDVVGAPDDAAPEQRHLLSWQALYANKAASTVRCLGHATLPSNGHH